MFSASLSLAKTLEAIAANGPPAVYGGYIGASWVASLNNFGSPIAVGDLAGYRTEVNAPISSRYRGLHVMVPPPNSQGVVLLEILAAIDDLDLNREPLGLDAPILARLFDRASDDRRYLADRRYMRLPVDKLLSKDNRGKIADDVRRNINRPRHQLRSGGDTVAVVTADAEGWAVSLIQSIYSDFGTAFLEPTTGVIFHNRGACFSADPHSPNVIAGGKRPLHTLMPVLILSNGNLAAVSGSMGGFGQPQINAMVLLRLFDLKMSARDAIREPRWIVGGGKVKAKAEIVVEGGVPKAVSDSFRGSGFLVNEVQRWAETLGHANLIHARDGRFEVASDPRADGSAIARSRKAANVVG